MLPLNALLKGLQHRTRRGNILFPWCVGHRPELSSLAARPVNHYLAAVALRPGCPGGNAGMSADRRCRACAPPAAKSSRHI